MLHRLRRGLKEAACNKVTGNQHFRHWQVNTSQSAYQLLQLANLIHYGPNNKVHVQLIKNGNKKLASATNPINYSIVVGY